MKWMLVLLSSFVLWGCVGKPEQVTPVSNFQLDRYLGQWYEIARLDHSFERGMTEVSAQYSMRDDGGVRVLNRGYSTKDNEWSDAEGKAYFVDSTDSGYLKVSFFGPFYGSYIVFELEQDNYDYAFVSGPDHSYLWLLSRTPTISDEIKQKFKSQAKELGFDTDKLIWVKQTVD
ncbi:lipocalin [Vibrio sp. UCD-FRSSP16_10]|uniref:lipocalin family protein n=1 Tax=unclassified Vibrio TaxID=2614977 RepID=UPI0007FF2CB6|nr:MULTISPECIES: lipocalin family protein [unclassified Vibrio]OBT16746.1 lipocalin [Vibrio sp. UCD-FRSSP16_30]OBT21373.1 lipocalin [Vibrio sp. UCD-FRSSP16_10]